VFKPYTLQVQSISTCLVKLDSAFQEELMIGDGLKLYLDSSWNPEWNTTCIGSVAAVPTKLKSKIKPEDTVLFSFRVVADRSSKSEDEIFTRVTDEKSKYLIKLISNKGNTVTCVGHWGKISVIWTGYYWDGKKGFQYGFDNGSHGEMERFLAKFNQSSEVQYTFKNLHPIDGEDYWSVSTNNLFAKLEDGQLIPIGDRLILEPIEYEVTAEDLREHNLYLPNANDVKIRLYDRGRAMHDDEPLGIKKGDIVSFDQRYVEKYQVQDKDIFLLKRTRADGIWQQ
jgi:co-chaperonin GroES (HSP10)